MDTFRQINDEISFEEFDRSRTRLKKIMGEK